MILFMLLLRKEEHQCLIQWRQNSCNVSGPSSCLPHFGSHLSWRLELHVPLYEYWEVDLVVDKGAGKQCIWHYHDMKRIRLIFMRLSTCSLVRQVVSVIFGCPRYGGCNPWILYLLKEHELVMLQCYYRTVLLSHSVIIAQPMLDFTIGKLKYLGINDNVHVKPGTWIGSSPVGE